MDINNREILKDYPEVLTAKMIAEILDLSYVNALKLIQYSGEIVYIKIGNIYKVPKRGFIDWLNSGTSKEINLEN